MEFNATFLVTIITFIVFVFLMNKLLYVPVLSIMETRKRFIDDNYRIAEENNAKSSELSKEKDEKLSEAKDVAKAQYNKTVDGFKTQRAEIIANAQNSAKDEIAGSGIELERVSNEVKNSLKGSMTDLANDIVEKVIGYRSEVRSFDEDAVNKVLWE